MIAVFTNIAGDEMARKDIAPGESVTIPFGAWKIELIEKEQ